MQSNKFEYQFIEICLKDADGMTNIKTTLLMEANLFENFENKEQFITEEWLDLGKI